MAFVGSFTSWAAREAMFGHRDLRAIRLDGTRPRYEGERVRSSSSATQGLGHQRRYESGADAIGQTLAGKVQGMSNSDVERNANELAESLNPFGKSSMEFDEMEPASQDDEKPMALSHPLMHSKN